MEYQLIGPLILFAFVSSITPGPNNIMLMSSGLTFGIRQTLSHLLGVCIGVIVMIFAVGLGMMQLFEDYPAIYSTLKIVCVLYLLYLAVKIATAEPLSSSATTSGKVRSRPLSFIQAALFQWVNPKAWTMVLTMVTVYTPQRDLTSVAILVSVFAIVNLPCISCWVVMGSQMRKVLASPTRARWFNRIMACLLVLSVIPGML